MTDADQCKLCEEPIEDETPVLLHGRFLLHGDCYLEVIRS